MGPIRIGETGFFITDTYSGGSDMNMQTSPCINRTMA
jgi:hypothetical protein